MESDKLFLVLFQSNPDLILRWLNDLPAMILETQIATSCGSGLGSPCALGGAPTLSAATMARVQVLPLEQLEALAEALLEFTGPADLATWMAAHT